MRLKKDTNSQFHQLQAALCGDLGVGLRGVTADILTAAMLRVCNTEQRYPELLAAVRDERIQRTKGDTSSDRREVE